MPESGFEVSAPERGKPADVAAHHCSSPARRGAAHCANAAATPSATYEGIIHVFVILNALRGTNAGAAIAQAIAYIRDALG